jgi:hypothetical protein
MGRHGRSVPITHYQMFNNDNLMDTIHEEKKPVLTSLQQFWKLVHP